MVAPETLDEKNTGAETNAPAAPPRPTRAETRLATAYEAIRRREYELITELIEVLPRVDGLGEDVVGQVRDALFHADNPFLIVFMGPFSAGKSSLINALLGAPGLLAVGPTPTTERIVMLRHGEQATQMRSGDADTHFYPSPLLSKVSFVDTPGLESVFQTHEETTRRFLHRSDAVFLVMLATQAMTASNLEYLKTLREYDKQVIILINQADLLTPEEQETVRRYTLEQSQSQLGYKPQVWLVSARLGLQARADGTLDPALWEASGLRQIERYIDEQLDDVARLRQKLQTPLQIVQSAHQAALDHVRANQATLDQYQRIADNVEAQMSGFKREQDKLAREVEAEIGTRFEEATTRGQTAIHQTFALSRALGLVANGLGELVGLAGLLRGGRASQYTQSAFTAQSVYAPIEELPATGAKLAPRLEGKDLQDMDDLVKYTRREIDSLPPAMQEKVIGEVQSPVSYDRSALQNARPALMALEDEARQEEMQRIEASVRNTLLYVGFYEALLIIVAIVLLATNPSTPEAPLLTIGGLMVVFALMLFGLVALPLRGNLAATTYARRMADVQRRYQETYRRATDKQIDYGMRLRRDVVAPLTRLIETQTTLGRDQLDRLQRAGQTIVQIETDLTKFRA